MNTDQLETFLAVADSRSFRRAADRLHISQSAVTVRIRQLEETIGKPLLLRETRHVELTPSGSAFLPYARQMTELLRDGIASSRMQGAYAHRLAIGGSNSILEHYLYPHLESFRQRHPDTSLHLFTASPQELFRQVVGGSLDAAVLYDNFLHPEMETIPLESSPLMLAGGERSVPGAVVGRNLLECNYVHLNWGRQFISWYEQQFGKDAIPRLTASHTSLLLRFIIEDGGIGFIPDKIAESFLRTGKLRRLPAQFRTEPPPLTFHLLYVPARQSDILRAWIGHLTAGLTPG